MQNLIKKFRQSSIVFEKLRILSENLKTLTSFTYPTVQYFLLKLFLKLLSHVSYLPISTKRCAGAFLFCLDLELFKKIKKPWFLHTSFLHFY